MGKNEEKERKYKSFIKEMYESIENENRMWAVLVCILLPLPSVF